MESLIKTYIDVFNEDPNIIGLYWYDNEITTNNIIKSIETNTKYNEYEMLTKEEQKAFDEGNLVF